MWVAGTIGGEKIKRSLDMTSWEAATDRIREWSSAGKIASVDAGGSITVEQVLCKDGVYSAFKSHSGAGPGVQADLEPTAHGSSGAEGGLERGQASWAPDGCEVPGAVTAILPFRRREPMDRDRPASALKPPKIIQKPTLPFTPAEMDKIIRACPSERDAGRDGSRWVMASLQ
jgi:hypothetical protein